VPRSFNFAKFLNYSMDKLAVFEQKAIRKIEHNGEIWFSIIDIIEVLTGSPAPRQYWNILKKRENQLSTICLQLKMTATDGRQRLTDCANTESVFRIIMSIPSPKAEPFKLWLAENGKQTLMENENPELGIERMTEIYRAKGYTNEWIDRRLKSIEVRKELTDEWKQRDVKEGQEFSILTATIAKETFGLNPSEHSKLKGLEKQNLRDHMTEFELIFTMLSESATRSIAISNDAQGFNENHEAAQKAGSAAGDARRNFEEKMGLKVVSSDNFLGLKGSDKTDALE
jgi:DNA-damage-inducible protein D